MVAGHSSYLVKLFDGIAQKLTPEMARVILDARVDDSARARVEYLRAQANEGLLTADEREEYADYVEAVDILGILQSRARSALAGKMS